MSKRGKLGLVHLRNPLYLNANLMYSEVLNFIKKPGWKRTIKTQGRMSKFRDAGHDLVTSTITRMEVMQRLQKEQSMTPYQSRKIFNKVREAHAIVLLNIPTSFKFTDALLDQIGSSTLDFKDALHLALAKHCDLPVCTHDKKILGEYSKHETKQKFYEQVYKPDEVIEGRISKKR